MNSIASLKSSLIFSPPFDHQLNRIGDTEDSAEYIDSTEAFRRLHEMWWASPEPASDVSNASAVLTKNNDTQLEVVHSRLEAIHNSAQRTETNLHLVTDLLKVNIYQNQSDLAELKLKIQNAKKIRGNQFIVNSYRDYEKIFQEYLTILTHLESEFDQCQQLLNRVKKLTSETYSSVDEEKQLKLTLENIESSRQLIEETTFDWPHHLADLEATKIELQLKLDESLPDNCHPRVIQLISEQKKESEQRLLENIKFLNTDFVITRTFNKTMASICKQIETLTDYINTILNN